MTLGIVLWNNYLFFIFQKVNKLYYDPNSGIYYYFDERSSSYQFHSQVELPASYGARQKHSGKGRGRGFEKKTGKRRVEETREVRVRIVLVFSPTSFSRYVYGSEIKTI